MHTKHNKLFPVSISDQVGSMLKTPKFPVWVVKTGERYGVLFSLNKELVNDWSVKCLYKQVEEAYNCR